MLAVLLLAMGAVGQVSRDPPACEKRANLIDQPNNGAAGTTCHVCCHVTANAQERHIYGLSC